MREKSRELFKLSAEDIQRAHSPEEVGVCLNVCGDCREKFRTAARLESSYKARAAFRDLLLMVPVFFVTFSLITRVFSGYAFLISVIIFFTAGINALRESVKGTLSPIISSGP